MNRARSNFHGKNMLVIFLLFVQESLIKPLIDCEGRCCWVDIWYLYSVVAFDVLAVWPEDDFNEEIEDTIDLDAEDFQVTS